MDDRGGLLCTVDQNPCAARPPAMSPLLVSGRRSFSRFSLFSPFESFDSFERLEEEEDSSSKFSFVPLSERRLLLLLPELWVYALGGGISRCAKPFAYPCASLLLLLLLLALICPLALPLALAVPLSVPLPLVLYVPNGNGAGTDPPLAVCLLPSLSMSFSLVRSVLSGYPAGGRSRGPALVCGRRIALVDLAGRTVRPLDPLLLMMLAPPPPPITGFKFAPRPAEGRS